MTTLPTPTSPRPHSEALARTDADDPDAGYLSSHDIESLLAILNHHRETVGPDRVLMIEFLFAPRFGYEPETSTLYQRLADDPAFFTALVTLATRPHTEAEDDAEDDRHAATRAYHAATSGNWSPATAEDGTIDADRLESWIAEARQQLAELDRTDIGDRLIGEALAAAPSDSDGGIAPPRPVREILDHLNNRTIERGLERGLCNRRGVVARALEAGGDTDRRLADTYRGHAKQIAAWTCTARALNGVADYYDFLARRADEEAERRRRDV